MEQFLKIARRARKQFLFMLACISVALIIFVIVQSLSAETGRAVVAGWPVILGFVGLVVLAVAPLARKMNARDSAKEKDRK